MKAKTNLPKLVTQFFDSCEINKNLDRYYLFLIRQDGVVLYHNKNINDSTHKASIGALLGGVWQASKALAGFIPNESATDVFRLSFDTSSRGVYILPVYFHDEEFYLGLIYHDEVNPGFLKSKMRELGDQFKFYLETQVAAFLPEPKTKKTTEENLFENITDEEMDRLFSFAGN